MYMYIVTLNFIQDLLFCPSWSSWTPQKGRFMWTTLPWAILEVTNMCTRFKVNLFQKGVQLLYQLKLIEGTLVYWFSLDNQRKIWVYKHFPTEYFLLWRNVISLKKGRFIISLALWYLVIKTTRELKNSGTSLVQLRNQLNQLQDLAV